MGHFFLKVDLSSLSRDEVYLASYYIIKSKIVGLGRELKGLKHLRCKAGDLNSALDIFRKLDAEAFTSDARLMQGDEKWREEFLKTHVKWQIGRDSISNQIEGCRTCPGCTHIIYANRENAFDAF